MTRARQTSAGWLAVVALAATLPLLSPAVARAATAFETNLIVNGNADAGSGASDTNGVIAPPGWTTMGAFTALQYGASGGFPIAGDPGPPDRGVNLFAGGPNNALSSASQRIDVSDIAATTAAGGVTFSLEGWLGGYGGQSDNAVLTISFRTVADTELSASAIGPVTAADRASQTGLQKRSNIGNVPPLTNSILVTLTMTRTAGTYNDGYADSLSLVLHSKPSPTVPEAGWIPGVTLAGLAAAAVAMRRRTHRGTGRA